MWEARGLVINPHHSVKRSWDVFVLLLVVYSSVSTPLQVVVACKVMAYILMAYILMAHSLVSTLLQVMPA